MRLIPFIKQTVVFSGTSLGLKVGDGGICSPCLTLFTALLLKPLQNGGILKIFFESDQQFALNSYISLLGFIVNSFLIYNKI